MTERKLAYPLPPGVTGTPLMSNGTTWLTRCMRSIDAIVAN
jgi:hypothetical protein